MQRSNKSFIRFKEPQFRFSCVEPEAFVDIRYLACSGEIEIRSKNRILEYSKYRVVSIDHFTERKASWVIRAKFDSSNGRLKKIFHSFHLGAPYSSGSYSLKILSKFMQTTQHLPETQDVPFSISFTAWTLIKC